MPNTEAEKTRQKLNLISGHARRDRALQFTSLAHLPNVEFLRDCYKSLARNKAVGIDAVSWEEYGENLEENLQDLIKRLKNKKYMPKPARRVYIPKSRTEKRPLGIPALENKVAERGITWILQRIYEEDFLDSSYGFRPGRNSHQALKKVHDLITFRPVNHVVEADIQGFFDNVDHAKLMEFIGIRIKDPSMLWLIRKFLKAGYIDDGLLVRPEEGTPQGSILSPLLANIFLHYVLDVWFEQTVKKHVRGFCELVRYADDFICVVRFAKDGQRIEEGLCNRLAKYGLTLHPEKSGSKSFGPYERVNADRQGRRPSTFDFLGFTHCCDVSRKGTFKIGRKTSRKKFRLKCKAMNAWLKAIRNLVPTKDWWKILRAKLRGHFQYYGVSENYASLAKFHRITLFLVRKWLSRRSQKRSMSRERFRMYLEHYPLPRPRIVHNFYVPPVW
jgi:group II intron reverse transcriptase/maturase